MMRWNNGYERKKFEKEQQKLAAQCRAAVQLNMVDEAMLKKAVCEKPAEQELILTGRNPADWMTEIADYSAEMHCWKYPYEKGIPARKGVEY